MNAVHHVTDDETLVLAIKHIVQKHGSLSVLNDLDEPVGNHFTKNSPERSSVRTPRKDSKGHNNLSKIPAPVFYAKT